MSKVFYDSLTNFKKLEKAINSVAATNEEKQELWKEVDSLIHHKIWRLILDKLQPDHHDEFIKNFTKRPDDKSHFEYLSERIGEDIKTFIRLELEKVLFYILHEFTEVSREDKKS